MQDKKQRNQILIRLFITGALIFVAYIFLTISLWNEQVRLGTTHRDKISRQSIRRIRTPAERGKIYSSDMRLLADNRPEYDAFFYLAEMRLPGRRAKTIDSILKTEQKLASLIGRKSSLKRAEVIQHMNIKPGLPMRVFSQLTPKEMGILHEIKQNYTGLEILPRAVREYPGGKLAAHILGFTLKADPKKQDDRKDFFYYIPDITGKRGVEKIYDTGESFSADGTIRGMRGIPGSRLVMVDRSGFIYKTLSTDIEAIDGNDIILTIDSKAQQTAEAVLQGNKGSIVLLDASTGAILAMASSPAFDPNIFSTGDSNEIRKLYNSKDNPLLNRAAQGVYTPGSIIKPLTGIALLEHGMPPDTVIFCDGATWIGDARIRCASWRRGGHGNEDIIGALEHSCNDFFIEKGTELSLPQLRETLDSAGIGKNTGFCLSEQSGLAPSDEYKRKYYKTGWNKYDTGLLSIGQGIILVTPLQAALYCAAIANGGTLWKPYLLQSVTDRFGNRLFAATPEIRGHLKVSAKNLAMIREGMYRVVNSPTGGGKAAKNPAIDLSGKTGTAEVGPVSNRIHNTWFICFGKRDGKTYAAAIMIEKGASGGSSCAPLAAEFFTKWLGPEKKTP